MKHRDPTPAESQAAVNTGRRRFARAGLAAPVVLGTLSSPPVLATNSTTKPPYHCTISGQLSGSKSRAPDSTNCKTLGRSPGYWKTHSAWPSPTKRGKMPDSSCVFATADIAGTPFGGFSYNGKALVDAFHSSPVSERCGVVDLREGSWMSAPVVPATMLQVLKSEGGLNDNQTKALGRATVATILNGLQFGLRYPLAPDKAIEMFNAVSPAGGTYQVAAGVFWNADQVKTYFESLYGAL